MSSIFLPSVLGNQFLTVFEKEFGIISHLCWSAVFLFKEPFWPSRFYCLARFNGIIFKLFWSALPHSKCLCHNLLSGQCSLTLLSILITPSKCYPQEFTPISIKAMPLNCFVCGVSKTYSYVRCMYMHVFLVVYA